MTDSNPEVVRLRDALAEAEKDADRRVKALKKQLAEARDKAKAVIQRQRNEAERKQTELKQNLQNTLKQVTDLQLEKEELVKYKDRAEELEALVTRGKDDLHKTLLQNETTVKTLNDTQTELAKLREEKSSSEADFERALRNLQEELKTRPEHVIDGTSAQLISDIKAQLVASQDRVKQLEATCDELRREKESGVMGGSTKSEDESGDSNGVTLSDSDGNQRPPISELWNEVRQAKGRADELMQELANTKEDFDKKRKELEQLVQKLNNEKERAAEKLATSEKRIVNLEQNLKTSELSLQEERNNVINARKSAEKSAGTSDEKTKILEAKVAEMERIVAAKSAEVLKVREKARTYLKDMSAEKREREEKMRRQVEELKKEVESEKEKVVVAEQRADSTTTELDNCLLLIREKQKTIQSLKMLVSTEKTLAHDAEKKSEELRAEFSAYKERARVALQEKQNVTEVSEDSIVEATKGIRAELEKSRKDVASLRHQIATLEDANASMDELLDRAEKAEAVADLLRKDVAGVSITNYSKVDELEEKLANVENELRTAHLTIEDSEDRHNTTKMRLEAAERAYRSAEVRSEEASRVSAKIIEGLRHQISQLEVELEKAAKSSAAAQRTAAAAAKALAFTEQDSDDGEPIVRNPPDKSGISSDAILADFTPYNGGEKLIPEKTTFIAAMERHSQTLGVQAKELNGSMRDGVPKEDLYVRDRQISVLTSQVAELSAMLDEAQHETNLKSEQTELLKTEVKNLDAKLAAAEKLQNGAPFSYLRTIVVRYLETDDPTLLPVISNVLSFTAEETKRVKATRSSRPSGASTPGSQKSSYFSIPFLGS